MASGCGYQDGGLQLWSHVGDYGARAQERRHAAILSFKTKFPANVKRINDANTMRVEKGKMHPHMWRTVSPARLLTTGDVDAYSGDSATVDQVIKRFDEAIAVKRSTSRNG